MKKRWLFKLTQLCYSYLASGAWSLNESAEAKNLSLM